MVKPFKVNISDQIIKDIYDKVKKYPWHEMPNDGGWEYGTNLDYMKKFNYSSRPSMTNEQRHRFRSASFFMNKMNIDVIDFGNKI